MNEAEIKPCPFCKSTSLIVDKKSRLYGFNGMDERIERHIYSARCNKCKASGPISSVLVFMSKHGEDWPLPDWATTDGEIRNKAIELWNGRTM